MSTKRKTRKPSGIVVDFGAKTSLHEQWEALMDLSTAHQGLSEQYKSAAENIQRAISDLDN